MSWSFESYGMPPRYDKYGYRKPEDERALINYMSIDGAKYMLTPTEGDLSRPTNQARAGDVSESARDARG